MPLPLLLAFQAAATAAPQPEIVLTPIDFDLASVRRLDPDRAATADPACVRADPDSIIVCGRRPVGVFPIEQWERIFARDPIRAETRLGGNMVGSVNVEQAPMLRGEVSNRLLLRVRVPF